METEKKKRETLNNRARTTEHKGDRLEGETQTDTGLEKFEGSDDEICGSHSDKPMRNVGELINQTEEPNQPGGETSNQKSCVSNSRYGATKSLL